MDKVRINIELLNSSQKKRNFFVREQKYYKQRRSRVVRSKGFQITEDFKGVGGKESYYKKSKLKGSYYVFRQ